MKYKDRTEKRVKDLMVDYVIEMVDVATYACDGETPEDIGLLVGAACVDRYYHKIKEAFNIVCDRKEGKKHERRK